MCIAILNTAKGGIIERERLQICWNGNRDGAGLAFPLNNELIIVKELHSFKKFYKAYLKAKEIAPDTNMIIHFRIKTHGHINTDNCHPFKINDELCFAHNGMIDGFDCKEKKKSDTVLFMEKVLRNMPKNFLEFEGCRRLIRKSTGWSKFVFLTSKGDYRIINEEGGTWDGENWYSNGTYKYQTYKDVGGKRVYAQGKQGVIQTYWQGKYGSLNSSGAFTEAGLPLETAGSKWPEKEYADFDIPFGAARDKDVRCCSECYTVLSGKMENHYGVCTKCLRDYEIIPKSD